MPWIPQLALVLAILILLASGVVWLVHLGKRSQAEKDTRERLAAEMAAKEQERKERDAFDEAGRTDLGPTPGVRVRPKDSGTS